MNDVHTLGAAVPLRRASSIALEWHQGEYHKQHRFKNTMNAFSEKNELIHVPSLIHERQIYESKRDKIQTTE